MCVVLRFSFVLSIATSPHRIDLLRFTVVSRNCSVLNSQRRSNKMCFKMRTLCTTTTTTTTKSIINYYKQHHGLYVNYSVMQWTWCACWESTSRTARKCDNEYNDTFVAVFNWNLIYHTVERLVYCVVSGECKRRVFCVSGKVIMLSYWWLSLF